MSQEDSFHVSVFGQIDSVNFPAGSGCNSMFIRYEFVAGTEWEVISGSDSGVSQTSSPGPHMENTALNMPIEVTFRSKSPFGWPQIILSVYGINIWGIENVLGYGRAHIPINIGHISPIEVSLCVPQCSNTWSSLASLLSARNPEIRDPKILFDGRKDPCLRTLSYGNVKLYLQVASRGLSNLRLDCG